MGNKNIAIGNGNAQSAGFGARASVTTVPPLTSDQLELALDLADRTGSREYNLIKSLTIDVGGVLEGPAEVIKNVSAIIRKVLRA